MSNTNLMLIDEYNYRKDRIRDLEVKNKQLYLELRPDNFGDQVSGEGNDMLFVEIETNSEIIRKLKEELKKANIVSPVIQFEVVKIGSKVSIILEEEKGSMEMNFIIGGVNTPIEGRYSINAPLVNSIIGAKKGEVRDIDINGSHKEITVQDISFGLENSGE